MCHFSSPVESPARIKKFIAKTGTLRWNADKRMDSIKKLFLLINKLAYAEIRYYYKKRNRSKILSIWSRIFAWVFGTLGLLAPLIAATDEPTLGHLTKWGYILLAASASFIAANSLFGGSSGHSRSVTTQLELEALVVLNQTKWAKTLTNLDKKVEEELLREAFAVILSLAQGLYKAIGQETSIWAQAIKDAINDYENQAAKGA